MAKHYDTIKDIYEDFNDTEMSYNKIVSGKNSIKLHMQSDKKFIKPNEKILKYDKIWTTGTFK